jgi:peptidoglycan/LPS O-acetylase OafA/YrhL
MIQPELNINTLISGVLLAGYLVVALFFLRFWRRTRDRLFAYFATAFAVLGTQRLLLALSHTATEDVTYLYVMRLAAFLLILWAIVMKNRED